jgi:hypothetical protein
VEHNSAQRKRKLLANVVNSRLLYAAPVWASALGFQTNITKILRPQKTVALRVAMGFKTVSMQAALIILGLIPAYNMVRERTKRYKEGIAKKEAREESYRKWQQKWDIAEEGRWTKRLIPDIEKWFKRRYGSYSYHFK